MPCLVCRYNMHAYYKLANILLSSINKTIFRLLVFIVLSGRVITVTALKKSQFYTDI